jgi:hypothetical protein
MPVAPAFTFGNPEQSWPHDPQFFASVFRSTQLLTQRSAVGAAQLDAHLVPVADVVHNAVAPVHLVVQLPQLCASVKLTSHPSSARDEQWPNPVAHAAGGT